MGGQGLGLGCRLSCGKTMESSIRGMRDNDTSNRRGIHSWTTFAMELVCVTLRYAVERD